METHNDVPVNAAPAAAPAPAAGVLASRLARLGAQIIDGVVVGVFYALASVIPKWGFPVTILLVLGGLGYFLLNDGLPGGQSLGKKVLSIRVVDAKTGAPCTYLQSLGRNAFLMVLGVIDTVFIFGGRRQRLGDMVAGTAVIKA